MFWYVLKLLILLPLIGAMIWGSLKLAKKMQGQFGAPAGGSMPIVSMRLSASASMRIHGTTARGPAPPPGVLPPVLSEAPTPAGGRAAVWPGAACPASSSS